MSVNFAFCIVMIQFAILNVIMHNYASAFVIIIRDKCLIGAILSTRQKTYEDQQAGNSERKVVGPLLSLGSHAKLARRTVHVENYRVWTSLYSQDCSGLRRLICCSPPVILAHMYSWLDLSFARGRTHDPWCLIVTLHILDRPSRASCPGWEGRGQQRSDRGVD